MSEARARMHLRDYVRQDDLDVAIQVMLHSFLSANKISIAKSLRKVSG
jgi:DNA replication licensing factor MCM2